jgi:hypothetical protein
MTKRVVYRPYVRVIIGICTRWYMFLSIAFVYSPYNIHFFLILSGGTLYFDGGGKVRFHFTGMLRISASFVS